LLYLDRTAVTDAGVAQIPDVDRLDELGLSETKVTDAGLDHVGRFRGLE
jgi:hypothetical protein